MKIGSKSRPKNTSSPFISRPIRKVTHKERIYIKNLISVVKGKKEVNMIAKIPKIFSIDNKTRSLVLSKKILDKIENAHGKIVKENLIITANDWDIALKNMDQNQDAINLIKKLPDSDNYLVIGARRYNGFYTVTHHEVVSKNGNELKSLLGRGDLISRDARPESQ